jgi:hypothetical protein
MIDPDLEGPRHPVGPDAHIFHDWSQPPAVGTRLKKAIALRDAERERDIKLSPARRKALNRRREEKRAIALGQVFDWRFNADDWFPVTALAAGESCDSGGGDCCGMSRRATMRDRDAGLDHIEYYRRQDGAPAAIVGQPHRGAWEWAKETGPIEEVAAECGVASLRSTRRSAGTAMTLKRSPPRSSSGCEAKDGGWTRYGGGA